MIKFLIQLGIVAGFGYYAGDYLRLYAEHHYGSPGEITAVFVIPFLAYHIVARIAGPVAGRLAGLFIVAGFYQLAMRGVDSRSLLDFSPAELLIIGAAILLAIFLPGGSAYRKLRTGASKAAIARGEEWAWEGRRFAVHIDFKAATARLIARGSMCAWLPGEGGKLVGHPGKHFDQTIPLHQFNLEEIDRQTKTEFIPNRASGWSNGELISVTLPGGTHVKTPNGFSNITFQHRGAHEASSNYAGLTVATGGPEGFRVVLFRVPNRETARFQSAWQGVAKRVDAAYTAFDTDVRERGQELLEEARRRRQAEAAAQEAADKQRAADQRSRAQERTKQLLQEAGMQGDFSTGTHTEGRIDWYIAADRNGRGLVATGSEVWQGSFAGAKARILSGQERGLDLELQDGAYEREHLKKRRMRIMQNAGNAAIQEWHDRVGILAAQTTGS